MKIIKKSILLVATIILLVGCGKGANSNLSDNNPTIDQESAKKIVQDNFPNGEIISINLDQDDDIPNYHVVVTDGDYRYEVEVDMQTGSIIEAERDRYTSGIGGNATIGNNDSTPSSGSTVALKMEDMPIDADTAKKIALEQVPNSSVVEFTFDGDDLFPHYEITVSDGSYEYEVEINATDGTVKDLDKEPISH